MRSSSQICLEGDSDAKKLLIIWLNCDKGSKFFLMDVTTVSTYNLDWYNLLTHPLSQWKHGFNLMNLSHLMS